MRRHNSSSGWHLHQKRFLRKDCNVPTPTQRRSVRGEKQPIFASMDKGFLGGTRNGDLCRPSDERDKPRAKEVREAKKITPTTIQRGNNTNAVTGEKGKFSGSGLDPQGPRRQKVARETGYLLRVRGSMSATVRACGNDAVCCIGQISELGNHGTLGAGLGRSDERS